VIGSRGPPDEEGDAPDAQPAPGAAGLARHLATLLRAQAVEWCRDRSWEVRVPVLIYFMWILGNHFVASDYAAYTSMLGGLNLGIHEAGHILFRPLGQFMTIAGGTILQCLAPIAAMLMFYKSQKDFFAVAFCFGWLSTNLYGCAIYAADARGQLNLVLVSPWGQGFGADGIGDWSRMLRTLGMLEWDNTISFFLKASGTLSMGVCFGFGGWLLWQMHKSRRG
jgi:hypothetical protein